MDRLPSEITDHIAECLEHYRTRDSNANLLALALCSRKFTASAYRVLWRVVDVRLCLVRDLVSAAAANDRIWHHSFPKPPAFAIADHPHVQLLNVVSSPHLVTHVKKLVLRTEDLDPAKVCSNPEDCRNIRSGRDQYVDSPIWRHSEGVASLITAVLLRLCNLEDVCLLLNSKSDKSEEFFGIQMNKAAETILQYFSRPSNQGRLRRWQHWMLEPADLKLYSQIPQVPSVLSSLDSLDLKLMIPRRFTSADWHSPDRMIVTLLQQAKTVRKLKFGLVWGEEDTDLPRFLHSAHLYVLESLWITEFCQHGAPSTSADYSQLDYKISRKSTIRNLRIWGADISSEWLLYILKASTHSLRSVFFYELRLASGTWGEVFHFMTMNLIALEELTLWVLGYDARGSSAHLDRVGADPIIVGLQGPQSSELSDYRFLEELNKVVAARAGQLVDVIDPPVFGPPNRSF